jgi:Spy/CpxP family protein refolding chaperone
MFGFVIGTLCFIGLIKVARSLRHGGGWGHHGYGRGGGRAARRRWMLRYAFSRLSTTPSQEKVILDAADALDAEREKLRAELHASRSDLASAMRGESFDEAKVRAAFERQQTVLAALQEVAIKNAKQVFDALQPDQRRQVVDLLEQGPRALHGGHGCGGYRYAQAC